MPESRKFLVVLCVAVAATLVFVWAVRKGRAPIAMVNSTTVDTDSNDGDSNNGPLTPDRSDSERSGENARATPTEPTRSAAETLELYVRKVHEVSKQIDDAGQELLQLTPTEEQQIGQFLHGQTLSVAQTMDGPPKERVERILAGILKVHEIPIEAVTVTVVQSDVLNAFSHVGGYIYVYSALLDFTSDDAELEFVLAHEFGHLYLGHCARKVTYVARAYEIDESIASAAALAYQIISAGYSEEQEFAADEFGLRTQLTLGRTAEPALGFVRRFADIQETQGEVRSRPKADSLMQKLRVAVDDHLRTHPYNDDRLTRLRTLQP